MSLETLRRDARAAMATALEATYFARPLWLGLGIAGVEVVDPGYHRQPLALEPMDGMFAANSERIDFDWQRAAPAPIDTAIVFTEDGEIVEQTRIKPRRPLAGDALYFAPGSLTFAP